ncbi:MAG: hypothetical protein AB7E76_02550 [Deferribacterales bacterium]
MSTIDSRMSAAAEYARTAQQRMLESEELRKQDREKAERSSEVIRAQNNGIATRSKELRQEDREEQQYSDRRASRAQEPGKGIYMDEIA